VLTLPSANPTPSNSAGGEAVKPPAKPVPTVQPLGSNVAGGNAVRPPAKPATYMPPLPSNTGGASTVKPPPGTNRNAIGLGPNVAGGNAIRPPVAQTPVFNPPGGTYTPALIPPTMPQMTREDYYRQLGGSLPPQYPPVNPQQYNALLPTQYQTPELAPLPTPPAGSNGSNVFMANVMPPPAPIQPAQNYEWEIFQNIVGQWPYGGITNRSAVLGFGGVGGSGAPIDWSNWGSGGGGGGWSVPSDTRFTNGLINWRI
jgi:hypothetical protein